MKYSFPKFRCPQLQLVQYDFLNSRNEQEASRPIYKTQGRNKVKKKKKISGCLNVRLIMVKLFYTFLLLCIHSVISSTCSKILLISVICRNYHWQRASHKSPDQEEAQDYQQSMTVKEPDEPFQINGQFGQVKGIVDQHACLEAPKMIMSMSGL